MLAGSCWAQITYQTVYVDYDSAWQFKNLKVIPIRAKKNGDGGNGMIPGLPGIIPLNKGVKEGGVVITERGTSSTENVHYLRVNNNSGKYIFISSGEIIAGGRQDRMVTRDTILAPSAKDQYIPVMCVEEGRWSEKEKKLGYAEFANPRLRKILDMNRNQVLIWREIGAQLDSMQLGNQKVNTLAYLSRGLDKKKVEMNDEYFRYFMDKFKRSDSTIVGFICITGNRILGTDIFAGTGLFYNQLEPLLKGYIDEAVLFGKTVSLPDPPVKEYMDKILTNETSQEQFVNKNGKLFRLNGKVIHINTF